MNAAVLVALWIGTTPVAAAEEPIAGLAKAVSVDASRLTRDRLRDRFLVLMKRTARNRRPLADPAKVVPALVRLDEDLRTTRKLSFAERRRKHLAIRGRLRDVLPRMQKRQREFARARLGRRPVVSSRSSLAGPADERQASELISLIQDTIAPDSWDVRGGKGTIRYYPNFFVLVVRTTAEVHGQIGGTLRQLKK